LPVSKDMLADLNPAAQGTFNNQVYSLGQFDVALLIFGTQVRA